MNLLEHKPQESSDTPEVQTEEPDFVQASPFLTELVRVCVQCGFSFVQGFEEVLQCVCPNCKRKEEERANARNPQVEITNLPVERLRTLPSIAKVLENLRKS